MIRLFNVHVLSARCDMATHGMDDGNQKLWSGIRPYQAPKHARAMLEPSPLSPKLFLQDSPFFLETAKRTRRNINLILCFGCYTSSWLFQGEKNQFRNALFININRIFLSRLLPSFFRFSNVNFRLLFTWPAFENNTWTLNIFEEAFRIQRNSRGVTAHF